MCSYFVLEGQKHESLVLGCFNIHLRGWFLGLTLRGRIVKMCQIHPTKWVSQRASHLIDTISWVDLLPSLGPSFTTAAFFTSCSISLFPATNIQAHRAGWCHWHQGALSTALTCQKCWSWASFCIRVRLGRVLPAQGGCKAGKRGIIRQQVLKSGLFLSLEPDVVVGSQLCPLLVHGKPLQITTGRR